MNIDSSGRLQDQVKRAVIDGGKLHILGANTKHFLGRTVQAPVLSTADNQGVIDYEPTELVITARAGTPLCVLESTLAESGQMLGFEPPHFGRDATLGGTLACGLSGPRRPYAGAARDFVLGAKLLNGNGDILSFGGRVMKNVAGYDLSRLMVGAMGSFGVMLEVSLKVLPEPAAVQTKVFELSAADAIEHVNRWAGQPIPISAAAHDGLLLYARLSGTAGGVTAAAQKLGGEALQDDGFWAKLKEQTLPFFSGDVPLWRISLKPAMAPLELPGDMLVDWGGALRWLRSSATATEIRRIAAEVGGHATLFRYGDCNGDVFQPLPSNLMALHKRIKTAFDPHGVFNPGRMYAEL